MAMTRREQVIRNTWKDPDVQRMAREWDWRRRPYLRVAAIDPSSTEYIRITAAAEPMPATTRDTTVMFELHFKRNIHGEKMHAIFSEGYQLTSWQL